MIRISCAPCAPGEGPRQDLSLAPGPGPSRPSKTCSIDAAENCTEALNQYELVIFNDFHMLTIAHMSAFWCFFCFFSWTSCILNTAKVVVSTAGMVSQVGRFPVYIHVYPTWNLLFLSHYQRLWFLNGKTAQIFRSFWLRVLEAATCSQPPSMLHMWLGPMAGAI